MKLNNSRRVVRKLIFQHADRVESQLSPHQPSPDKNQKDGSENHDVLNLDHDDANTNRHADVDVFFPLFDSLHWIDHWHHWFLDPENQGMV